MKYYDKTIVDATDWGGDSSTGGLRVSGGRVQEYIKGRFSGLDERMNKAVEITRSGIYKVDSKTDGGLWYDSTTEIPLASGDVVSCKSTSPGDLIIIDKSTMARVGYATNGGKTFKATKAMTVLLGGNGEYGLASTGAWTVTSAEKSSMEDALALIANTLANVSVRTGEVRVRHIADNESVTSKTNRVGQTLGHYSSRDDIALTAIESGVAISKDGVKVAKEGWAIAEFTAIKGNEYLLKPGTMSGDVCLFAEKITKEEVRNIDYTYTYNEDGSVATARATYLGSTHSYTYSYERTEEGNIASTVITDGQSGARIDALPYQYKTKVGTYQPMTVLNADAELPEDGYCRLVSHFQNDSSLVVVVSFNTADADLSMKVLRDGFTASICTQLGNLSKRIGNTTECLSGIDARSEGNYADIAAVASDALSRREGGLPTLAGQPMILFGTGTPQEGVVPVNWKQFDPDTGDGYNWTGSPTALGQQYINTSATFGGRYIAVPGQSTGTLVWKNF